MISNHWQTSLFLAVVSVLAWLLPQAVQASEAAADFAGAYAADLVWEGAVTMSGDVLILAGGSLTIKAGTEVTVVPAEGTKIDPE